MQRVPAAILIYGALGATVAVLGVLAYWKASSDSDAGTATLRQPEIQQPAPKPSSDDSSGPTADPQDEPTQGGNTRPAPAPPSQTTPSGGTAKPDAFKRTARYHFRHGRYRAAARAYRRATELNPKDAAAFAGLGGSLLALDKATAAITAYRHAVRLSPRTSGFYAALGRALVRSDNPERAKAAYRRAAQLDPGNRAATAALAQLDR